MGAEFQGIRGELARRESLDGVPFEGFEGDSAAWVRRQIERIGLPTDNVSRVRYRANDPNRRDVLGQVHLGTGELTLFKSLETLPEVAQLSTITHELLHENDPYQRGNESLYTSREEYEHAQTHARAVAMQTEKTGVYLNGYHRALCAQLRKGEISETTFAMETHAIMGELRYTNPNHLRQVQDAQEARLAHLHSLGLFQDVRFTAIMSDESNKAVGIDRTMIALIDGVNNLEELNDHLVNVRESFSKDRSPLSKAA